MCRSSARVESYTTHVPSVSGFSSGSVVFATGVAGPQIPPTLRDIKTSAPVGGDWRTQTSTVPSGETLGFSSVSVDALTFSPIELERSQAKMSPFPWFASTNAIVSPATEVPNLAVPACGSISVNCELPASKRRAAVRSCKTREKTMRSPLTSESRSAKLPAVGIPTSTPFEKR